MNKKFHFLFAFVLVALVSLTSTAVVRADTRVGPLLTFEVFNRDNPERLEVVRPGAGVRLVTDILSPLLALDAGILYSNETDYYSSGNTFEEQIYRFRLGLIARVSHVGPLYLALRAGPQFSYVNNEYRLKVTGENRIDQDTLFTPYFGGEIQLLPWSGFGLQMGVAFFYEKTLEKFVPQYFFGIAL